MALLVAQEPAVAASAPARKPMRPTSYPNKAPLAAASKQTEPIHKARRGGLRQLMDKLGGVLGRGKSKVKSRTPATGGAQPAGPVAGPITPEASIEIAELAPQGHPAIGAVPVAPADLPSAETADGEHLATIVLDRQGGGVSRVQAGRESAAPVASAAAPVHTLPSLENIGGSAVEQSAVAFPEATVRHAPPQPQPGIQAAKVSVAAARRHSIPAVQPPAFEAVPVLPPLAQPKPVVVRQTGWRGGYHVVKNGEDLAAISLRYGVTDDAVLRYNRLPRSGALPSGKKVYVPASGARRIFTATGPAIEPEASVPVAVPAAPVAVRPIPPAVGPLPPALVTPANSSPPSPQRVASAARSADDEDDDRGPIDKIKDAISGVFDGFKKLIGRGSRRKPQPVPATGTAAPSQPEPAPVLIAKPPTDNLGRPRFAWPISGTILSRFGPRRGVPHNGIDISSSKGTPIHAAAGGTVIFSSVMRGYGNVVILDHGNRYFTVYAHNQKNLVSRAAAGGRPTNVKAGQTIALVGNTGNAQSPHVHFEVRLENKAIDPLPYLPAGPEAPQASRPTPAARVAVGQG